jgi:hypothetical protein
MNHITVKGPTTNPLCELDSLVSTDAFVGPVCKALYLVVTPSGHRSLGTIDCLRLYPDRGLNTFRRDLMVHPVDIKVEWTFCSETHKRGAEG